MTSNVPWWSASRGHCRAWYITTWRPTGPGVLWTFCRPCCALITPHITAPLAWRRAPWTGLSRSKYGNACTRRDVHDVWQAWAHCNLHPATRSGWARPVASSPRATRVTGPRRSFVWKPCETPVPWPTSWPMPGVNQSMGLSMAQNSRKWRRLTTLTWNPSWTRTSGERSQSTWLSGPVTWPVSTPGNPT